MLTFEDLVIVNRSYPRAIAVVTCCRRPPVAR